MEPSARERYEAAKMSRGEFDRLRRGEWAPVSLDAASRPAFLSNLPAAKIVATFGSASLDRANPVTDGNPDHGQVGGIDVYRVAEAEDGVAINKDWYAIYQDPDHDDQFYVIGPQQDAEHWINTIPNRLAFAEPASVEASIAAPGSIRLFGALCLCGFVVLVALLYRHYAKR